MRILSLDVRRGTRLGFGIIVPALAMVFSGLAAASAEPSPTCRDLAGRFASAAAELDTRALAGLMACVSTEMVERTGGPLSPSPAGSAGETPPPSAPPAPPPRISERGAWPPPPPWGGDWPTAAPWDR